jgi:SHAQKYF class myb-like DNA-binding protein
MINYGTFWVCFFRWHTMCPNRLQLFKHTSPKFCSFLLLLEKFMLLLTLLPWQIVPQPSHACVGHQNFMKPLWMLSITLVVVNVCNSHAPHCGLCLKVRNFLFNLFITHFTGATPKGVLKLMKVEGLTIYHVKSHLQVFVLYFFSL